MDAPDGPDASAAFAGGAPLDSLEAQRAEAAVRESLFGRADPIEIGRFRILDHVGRGGMGIVYSAWDPDLERRVAIKVVRALQDNARGRERLLAEARAAARLSHPHVVTVHEAGEAEGRVFLAMEYVEGDTLAGYLAHARSVDEILAVFRQAGRGLWAAHQAGLVHRDFKPANVLLATDEAGHVHARVADFGLAALVELGDKLDADDPAVHSKITSDGAIVGTPAYMAPEQFRGEHADARSDQYSFCVSLYEALHGRLPGEDRSRRELPKLGATVPRRVGRALLRGLSSDPTQRFEDMGALLAELAEPPRRAWWLLGLTLAGVAAAVAVWAQQPEEIVPCQDVDAPWQAALGGHDLAGVSAPATETLVAGVEHFHARWEATRKQVCEATHVSKTQSAELMDLRMSCLDERVKVVAAIVRGVTSDPRPSVTAAAVEAAERVDAPEPRARAEAGRLNPAPIDPGQAFELDALTDEFAELHAATLMHRTEGVGERLTSVVQRARALGHRRVLARALDLEVAFTRWRRRRTGRGAACSGTPRRR